MIAQLLSHDPATIHMADGSGSLPIHIACRQSPSLAKIELLVNKGGVGILSASDGHGALPLHALCESEDPPLEAVQYLLEMYPQSISEPRRSDWLLPIMIACMSGASESVLYVLLKARPEVLSEMIV